MAYSLGIRCLSEFLGMLIVIYTGEAALANELLPSTKGHGMGWGWTVFTFGFAFLAPLQIFSKVSAKLNPAMCLAQWVWGNLTGVDFICLSLAEIAGAFVGAALHWIHFLPHYKTLPEPPAESSDDSLLRRRDQLKSSALQIASYTTRPDRKVTRNPIGHMRNTLYYLRKNEVIHEETPSQVLNEYYMLHDHYLRRPSLTAKVDNGSDQPLARRTIQVADLQRHLEAAHVERVLRQRTCPKCQVGDSSMQNGSAAGAATARTDTIEGFNKQLSSDAGAGAPDAGLQRPEHQQPDSQMVQVLPDSPQKAGPCGVMFASNALERERQRANALYKAAVEADQNAKLSIFATRPAIYAPLYNFITEAMGTTALLLLALLVELQARRFPEGSDIKLFYEVGVQSLILSFIIVVLIAGKHHTLGWHLPHAQVFACAATLSAACCSSMPPVKKL
eukprot:GHRR01012555.1.p1 GENE.GHRR01012555.1~~GHRR01012555.1.p1  ORF type:complete len:447 (+),score=108.93 GHRR01012555.1:2005-3345(+)